MVKAVFPNTDDSLDMIIDRLAEGKLRDEAPGASQFRELLEGSKLSDLENWLEQALSSPSDGRALQDIVNVLGQRLGFDVEHGRYAGKKGQIGFDGLWQLDSKVLLIECKKTDTYRISTQTLLDYAQKVEIERRLEEPIPILLVVGNFDTGDIEAQIRGSRIDHLFSVVGVRALLEIVKLSETLNGGPLGRKIPSLLFPHDHTRLDNLVNIMTDLLSESEQAEFNRDDEITKDQGNLDIQSSSYDLLSLRNIMIAKIEKQKGKLVKASSRTKVQFTNGEGETFIFLVSKRYDREDLNFWYSIRHDWKEIWCMTGGGLVLGYEGGRDLVYIEGEKLMYVLEGLNRDISLDKSPWQMAIRECREGLELELPRLGRVINLGEYQLKLGEA